MEMIKRLCRELGLTKRLYGGICLILLAGALFQWVAPVAGEPIARAFDYQYGLIHPWLHIHKTADLGSLHLFQALSNGDNLSNAGELSWVINGAILWDALLIWAGVGLVKYFYRFAAAKGTLSNI